MRKTNKPVRRTFPGFGLVLMGAFLLLLNLFSEQPLLALWNLEQDWEMQRWEGLRDVDAGTGKSVTYRANFFAHQRGFTMCACEAPSMFTSVLYNIKAMRTRWKSKLPITVAHCNELSEKSVQRLREAHKAAVQEMGELNGNGPAPILDIANLCVDAPRSKKKRLRSWFCKTGALIASPYQETMLVDTDVVWLQNPEKLFEATLYKDTGSLFFRDRYLPAASDSRDGRAFSLQMKYVQEYISQHRGGLDWDSKATMKKLYENNYHGINYYWADSFPSKDPAENGVGLAHVQESSVVLLDASKMRRTARVLREILPTFKLGYGDKEIYWLAATIANESFSLEPYLQGMYGDCGHILHFDPTGVTASDILGSGMRPATTPSSPPPRDVEPFFLNGQYVAEGVSHLGAMMDTQITRPQLASIDQKIRFMGQLNAMTHAPCGACENAGGCIDVPAGMNEIILDQQRFQLEQVGPPRSSYPKMVYSWLWKRLFAKFTPVFLLS